MPNYVYPQDGKLHTRFSELVNMTDKNVKEVAIAHVHGQRVFKAEAFEFGTARHEAWEAEAKKTGKLPKCFLEIGGLNKLEVANTELGLVSELTPGIVLHSTLDVYCPNQKAIVDYKTKKIDGKLRMNDLNSIIRSPQGRVYAWQLAQLNKPVDRMIYLFEIWNADRTEIVGYRKVEHPIGLGDISEARKWLLYQTTMLEAAIDEVLARSTV